jgi:ubiquinone/menaquinone biosynthesis C-methylase UbiE
MDSNSLLKEAYRILNEEVVYNVSATDVMDSLFAAGVLPAAKYSDLCHAPNGPQQTRLLMAFLHTVGHPEAFMKFHAAIIKRQVSYAWLVEAVNNICTQQTHVTYAAAKFDPRGRVLLIADIRSNFINVKMRYIHHRSL